MPDRELSREEIDASSVAQDIAERFLARVREEEPTRLLDPACLKDAIWIAHQVYNLLVDDPDPERVEFVGAGVSFTYSGYIQMTKSMAELTSEQMLVREAAQAAVDGISGLPLDERQAWHREKSEGQVATILAQMADDRGLELTDDMRGEVKIWTTVAFVRMMQGDIEAVEA